MLRMTKDVCMKALYGGLLLGGGGGGALADGIRTLEAALMYTDAIQLMSIDELDNEDIIINASMVGAPSAQERFVTAHHWKKALENFKLNYSDRISGIITNENGGMATANGWLVSAISGIPIIDAPSNGRAQPTSTMGSMSLSTMPEYQTVQSACGGRADKYLEVTARGTLATTAKLIRQTAVFNGGMSAVLRNPVSASYIRENAALGGISHAISIGGLLYGNIGHPETIFHDLHEKLQAEIICSGTITEYALNMTGGFDVGSLSISDQGDTYSLTFWNEYMTLEKNGERIGTFPDLLATLDTGSGLPLPSAELSKGNHITIIKIPRSNLCLGAGMFIRAHYEEVENVIHKDMITYCF